MLNVLMFSTNILQSKCPSDQKQKTKNKTMNQITAKKKRERVKFNLKLSGRD